MTTPSNQGPARQGRTRKAYQAVSQEGRLSTHEPPSGRCAQRTPCRPFWSPPWQWWWFRRGSMIPRPRPLPACRRRWCRPIERAVSRRCVKSSTSSKESASFLVVTRTLGDVYRRQDERRLETDGMVRPSSSQSVQCRLPGRKERTGRRSCCCCGKHMLRKEKTMHHYL